MAAGREGGLCGRVALARARTHTRDAPHAQVYAAAGHVGFGGAESREALAELGPSVPFIIRCMHPKLTPPEYR